MTVRKRYKQDYTFYYITFTCYNWFHLFELTKIYDYIYKWFDILQDKYKTNISAYVIMPNHMHFIMFASELSKDVNNIVSNGKRFIAYEIIKKLKIANNFEVLETLKKGVSDKDKNRGKLHKVFETSSDIKILASDEIIGVKINYIHMNPVRKGWNLVDDFRKYKYSSAGFYEDDVEYWGYPVVHYSEANNIVI